MKGQIHTEWVISLGIFLLYVIGMMFFIKPGFVPYYSEKELISLVETGLKENYYWTVKKVPLFVEECNCPPDDNKCIIVFSLKANGWGDNGTYGPIFDGNNIPPDGTVFWFSFKPNNGNKDFVIRDMSNGCDANTRSYRIGTAENVYGVKKSLETVSYGALKNKLKYPNEKANEKDFILSLNDNEIKNKEPPQGVNIYVKEWDDFYVDENGERAGVKVSIKVW